MASAEATGRELPVLGTVPEDGAHGVRPDTAISFQLDTAAPAFRSFRQQMESGRFALQIDDGTEARLFGGAGTPPDTLDGVATYDARTGTVSAPALSLRRYTTYTVTLAVKAAYQALLHGHSPLPENAYVTFAFVTGSALNEPTRYLLAVDSLTPRVTEEAQLTVVLTDDYGNPAWGATLAVGLSEDGARLPQSAVSSPAQAVVTEANAGQLAFTLTDVEAERVSVTVTASGAFPQNGWSGTTAVSFRPGLPAAATLTGLPATAEVGTPVAMSGHVFDLYGNLVEDGSELQIGGVLQFSSQSVTTRGGAFSATVDLPTVPGAYTVTVASAGQMLASSTVTVVAGPPAAFSGLNVPGSLRAGESTSVCDGVVDRYGNSVADGTEVTVEGTAVTTSAGAFCASIIAPTTPGIFVVDIQAGAVSTSSNVTVLAGQPAIIGGVIAPSSVQPGASFEVSGNLMDAYGNPVEVGTSVTVGSVTVGTTAGGFFSATVTAPSTPGSYTIPIQSGSLQSSVSVQVVPPPPANVTLSVTLPSNAQNGSVPADGTSMATLTATITDAQGLPVANGLVVTWSTTLGTLSASSTATTNGRATVTLRSSQVGTATVTVRAGSITRTAGVSFAVPGGSASRVINLSYAQPCWGDARYVNYGFGLRFRAKQGCNINVSGTALDAAGQPARNATITVSLQTEASGSPSRATVTTDSNGRFTASVLVWYGFGLHVYDNWVSFHYWDWGYLSITSGSRSLASDSIYAFAYSIFRPH
jgi:adhesin/invasin